MIRVQIGWEPAILAVLGVLAIFLFPVVQGPYSAVNGPVTALQAASSANRIKCALAGSAQSFLGNCLGRSVIRRAAAAVSASFSLADLPPIHSDGSVSILRC